MKDIEKLISPLIEQQFPDIYKDEGQNLIAFVKAYFEWMEQTNGVLYDSRRLPDYRDIDKTVDEFIDQFRTKYMHGIPRDAVVDKRILQKHIKEVYATKGTTRGLQLLFRLLYNEDVEVYLPGDDVLKASDGHWYVPKYLEMESNANLSLYVGKNITGRVSGATAYVKDYQSFYIGSRIHNILYLEDLVGNFSATEEIVNQEIIDDLGIDITQSPRIIGSLSSIDVTFSEPGFRLGEIVTINDGGSSGKAIVTGVKKLNGIVDFAIVDGGNGYRLESTVTVSPSANGFNASFIVGSISNTTIVNLTTTPITGALAVSINAGNYSAFAANAAANIATPFENTFTMVPYTYGTIETLAGIDPGSGYNANATVDVEDSLIYALRIPDGSGGFFGKNANITGTAAFGSGAIANLVVYDSGVGYTNGSIVTILSSTNNSIQATGVVTSAKHGIGQGFFKDSKGFLNSDKFVHDNYFYQDYSYEVRANLALNKYAGVLRDLWHPAGVERFGRTTVKDEYKSRGTTVEALIDWLETIEVTVNTTRFTDTLFTTQYLTTTTFSTSKGTEYTTAKYTSKSTTFETAISILTTFNTSTVVETATAITINQDTIYYTSTIIDTTVKRSTSTLVSTIKVPATVTALSTAYATDTFKSTASIYDTSSALGATTIATSTAGSTTTSYSTIKDAIPGSRSTSILTSYLTTYFDETQPVEEDGFSSEAAAIRAAIDAGLENNPAWSCSYYEYGPVPISGSNQPYLYKYVCLPEVSTTTSRETKYSTSTTISTQTNKTTSTLKSTDTTYDTLGVKSTSISTSTIYATDTTISSFRITGTTIVADTAYGTDTLFERSTVYDTLPVRNTLTSRLSYYSTKFDTTYATISGMGVGSTTIETSKETSAATNTKYFTESSIITSTITSYVSTKLTSFDTTYDTFTNRPTSTLVDTSKLTDINVLTSYDTSYNTNSTTGIVSTTVQTSRNTSFLTDITKYQTSRDTGIAAGTQIVTSKNTEEITLFETTKLSSRLTEYYNSSLGITVLKLTDILISTAFDTTYATASGSGFGSTTVQTSRNTFPYTTFDTFKFTNTQTFFLTDNITSLMTEYLTAKDTTLLTNTEYSTYVSPTLFETSVSTEKATEFNTSTSYITIYNTQYRTVTYTGTGKNTETSIPTQLFTLTAYDTFYDTVISTSSTFATNKTTSTVFSTITKVASTTTVYNTAFATSTIFNTETTRVTGVETNTSTSKDTTISTDTTKSSQTTYLTNTTFDTIYDTSKTTTFGTSKTQSTSKATDTNRTTTFLTASVYDTMLSTFRSTDTFRPTTTIFGTSNETSRLTTFNTAFIAQDDVDTLSVDTSATSTSSAITVPASAQTGQVAVLFDYGYNSTTTTVTNVRPTGWTNIANTANNSAGTGRAAFNCSYKILTSSDPGSSVTGINASGQNNKIMLILTVGANVEIGSVTVASAGFNPPIDTAVANVSVALDTVSEGYTTSLILGFYGASSTPATRQFLGEPIPFDEIEQGIVTDGTIAVKYQNANAVEIDNSDTSVRLNMSDGGNKNLLGGVRISVNGSTLTRATSFTTAFATNYNTSKDTSTTYNTTTTFNTSYATTVDTNTSRTTTFATTTVFNTTFLTQFSKLTSTETSTSTSNSTDTFKSTITTYSTSTTYATVFDTKTGAVVTAFATATSNLTDTSSGTSKATDTTIDTITSNNTSTVFNTSKTTNTAYLTSVGTSVSTYTKGITTVETGIDTFFDTKISTVYDTVFGTSTVFDTKELTSTKFALTAINYDATTFVTSIDTQYDTNKTTTTTINSGTTLITSVDTDTIFETIVATDLNTEPT